MNQNPDSLRLDIELINGQVSYMDHLSLAEAHAYI
jgi:hypothetical protein